MMESRQAVYEVELYLGYLRLTGKLTVAPARRLSDSLNDSHNPLLTLSEVSIQATRHGRSNATMKVPTSLVIKEQVELARLAADEQRSRLALVQTDAVIRKVPHPVVFFLPNYLVRGKLHLVPDATLEDALSHFHDDFIAVTEASIIPVHAETPRDQQRSFVSVSRRHVLAIYSEDSV